MIRIRQHSSFVFNAARARDGGAGLGGGRLRSLLSSSSSSSLLLSSLSALRYDNGVGAGTRRRGMCGLVAAIEDVWTSSSSSSSSSTTMPAILSQNSENQVLHNATSKLHHRGPDGMKLSRGKFNNSSNASSASASAAHWSMGHTRLAIVDPTNRNADMPFCFTFNNLEIKLVANGEIYNHVDLYNSLCQEGENKWTHERQSGSDCEIIAHAIAHLGGTNAVCKLDGMFAFVAFINNFETGKQDVFAARDPVGIKPLYYGRSYASEGGAYMFASELKALVDIVDPSSVRLLPAGHYWTPQSGEVRYYSPDWLMKDDYAPWEDPDGEHPTDDEIRNAFTKAVQKRMMSDVEYGFFLSGGIDSCVVAHDLLPLYTKERRVNFGDDRPIPTFTVGMENSPDVMAAKAMVESLGGSRYITHTIRSFTIDDVLHLIPQIVYHMETYEAELIRSAIPNWLLAQSASEKVKMVLTGEGADELFAGYLYFQHAQSPAQLQNELRRIYGMLGNVNLHRTDRMTMAHGLEARVPFLDTKFSQLIMSVDPKHKMVNSEAVQTNSRGREKTLLRELFGGPNSEGNSIPNPVLWRAKAMQCEGVGEDWVSMLQNHINTNLVSDAEMLDASVNYPINTPHTKEELYYRRIYDEYYHGLEHVVNLWEGGGRAMGAPWKSDVYTREGLKNVNVLSHSLQDAKM